MAVVYLFVISSSMLATTAATSDTGTFLKKTSITSTVPVAKGFWYSAFSAGGSGAPQCTPITGSLLAAPGSNTHTMSAWFDGNSPSTWCTGTNPNSQKPWISYFDDRIKFPGNFGVAATNWEPITNSFTDELDDFQIKWFTVGGGQTVWTTAELGYLLADCSDGKSLTQIIADAGYTGIMIDYEQESDMSSAKLGEFMVAFNTSVELSFTVMGDGGGQTATSTLTQALANVTLAERWAFVVPQLYDQYSCLYDSSYMTMAKQLFNDVEQTKILFGIPQGVDPDTCCSEFGDKNGGFVEWLYRPVPKA